MGRKLMCIQGNAVLTAAVILIICLCAAGCGRPEGEDMQTAADKNGAYADNLKPGSGDGRAAAGILLTKDAGGGSKIVWLDDELKQAGGTDYDFSAMYFDGFRNMCSDGSKVWLFPRGDYEKKNYSKMITLDLGSRTAKKTRTGRTNVTGWTYADGQIAFSSNENGVCHLDILSLKTGRKRSMALSDRTVFDLALHGGKLYGMALTGNLKVRFESYDLENGRAKVLEKLPDSDTPGFLQVYKDDILFVSDGELVRYDTETGDAGKVRLTRDDAYNLNLSGDTLWIAYTDVFGSSGQSSLIEARDAANGDILAQCGIEGPVVQMEVTAPAGNTDETSGQEESLLWILGERSLSRYSFTGDDIKLKDEIGEGEYRQKGYDTGGIVVVDRQYGGLSEEEALELNGELVDKADRMEVMPDK